MNEFKQAKIKLILLFSILIVVIISAYFNITTSIKISHNQIQTLNNQYTNAVAEETFIRKGLVCIFTTPSSPNITKAQITTEVDNCFVNTPEIK